MRTSIKLKSTVFLAALLLLTLGILSITVLRGIGANQQLRYENLLSQQAKLANLYIQQGYAAQSNADPTNYLTEKGNAAARQISQLIGTHVVLYNLQGKEIGKSAAGLNVPDIEETLVYALQGNIAYQKSDHSIYYMAPVSISERQTAVVQLYYSLNEDYVFYNNIKNLFLNIGSLIFIMSFISAYLYFNRMTSAIYKLKAAVSSIKQGNYKDIPVVDRRDELGDLRQGIFYMSSQIEQSIESMKEEQQKLKLALEKLKALEQQQRQFIGNVTHEFKTPLTVIKAYMDLMRMYPEDQKLIEDAKENIDKETNRLHEMVEKTLQLATLQKYDFEAEKERVPIGALISDICDRMEGKVQKFGLTLYRDIEEAEIWADRESIFQIFINLIDNAIKYNSPSGSIKVKSYINKEKVNVEISDTGIGIPKDSIDKIFEAFYRVDKDRARETGGAGLGLALVKQLVEKQGGIIAIADTGNQGTTFITTFPLAK